MEELGVSVLNNPVHGKMNLNLSGTWSGNFEIIIYSMNGTLMFSASEMKSSPVQDYAFDLDSELSPGVYLVVGLYGNNRTLPVKMIVY